MNPENHLFDVYERSDQRPSAYREPKFFFWNRSGWAAASRVRDLLERIYSSYPIGHRSHIRSRFRSNRDGDFHGALLELLLFAMLDPRSVQVNADTPDFEFERLGHTYALEAKAFDEYEGSNSLEGQVLDRIEKELWSEDYFVSIMPRGELNQMPPDRCYIRPIEELLKTPRAEFDLDTTAGVEVNLDPYAEGLYRLDVGLLPKSTHSPEDPLIGALSSTVEWVGAAEIKWCARLLRGLERKARVLATDGSYIAVSVPSDPPVASKNVAIRALYGSSGETRESGLDCFWRKQGRPRNTHVHGVVVFGALLAHALDHQEMVGRLYMAPGAGEPPEPLAQLPRIWFDVDALSEQSGAKLGTLVLDGLRAAG